MGVFMLSEFFRKSGWRVLGMALQGALSAERCVQSDWFDVVGLSISIARDLDSVGRLIRRLRQASANPELKIMVGGPMVALNRGLMLSLGADFIGGDARESQRLASQYVKKDPRCKAEHSYCNITIDAATSMPRLTLLDPRSAQSTPTTQTNRWP
jgi:methanogenic corrinoid protein MtbC1